MGALNQTNFPRLWRIFQWSIGGGCHKRALARERLGERRNVLEVGCSVGNIAEGFRGIPELRYTGVDIDAVAVASARRAFRDHDHFKFYVGNIEEIDLPAASFDFIVLSAVLHHVDDEGCRNILHSCAHLLAADGMLLITEPVLPLKDDPRLVHFFNSIEQGCFVRSSRDFLELVASEEKLRVVSRREFFLAGSPLGFPRITRCMTLEMRYNMLNVDKAASTVPGDGSLAHSIRVTST